MSAKLLTAGLIGLGCIAAAAGGGYVALRSNAADLRPAPAALSGPAAVAPAAAPSDQPVALDVMPASETPGAAPIQPKSRQIAKPETRSAAGPPAAPSPTPAPQPPVSAEVQPVVAVTSTPPPATTAPPVAPATPAAPPAPTPRYDEVTVAADSVLGVRLDSTISSETARVEDRVNARLSRDVIVDGRVAIPSGARLEGTVTQVDRGGKFKDRPRVGIAFNTLVLADGTRVTIQTDTIFREGASPSAQVNTKVGGSAVVGAILGAMIGGKKGALLGSTVGAAGGAAAVAAGDRAEASMMAGTQVTARLTAPVTVLIERDHE